jgi:ribose 5-phosphate isomerase A
VSGESDALRPIATRALDYVEPGTIIGLGTGRAASAFVEALGERVRGGLDVRGVPTSEATAALASKVGVPLLTLDEAGSLAATFDGADEVSPGLDLIKGYGGALVREKIVAASSERLIILVGDEKRVDRIGARGRLPVEVVPFARALCEKRLAGLGCPAEMRVVEGKPYLTDNLNLVLDCAVQPIADPEGLERDILAIPGVLGTGLFLGMADAVLVQEGDAVLALERD